MQDCLETPGAADENQSRAPGREHLSQAGKIISRHTGSEKVWTVFCTAWLVVAGLHSFHPSVLGSNPSTNTALSCLV